MTDFTPEQIKQIEAAFSKTFVGLDDRGYICEDLIAALTRTQWKPQEGEVHCWWNEMGKEPFFISYEKREGEDNFHRDIKMRPLTPDEVPAWKETVKVAIMCFGRLTCTFEDDGDRVDYAEKALAKINELTAANEDR